MVFVFVDNAKGDITNSKLTCQYKTCRPCSSNKNTRDFFLFHRHPSFLTECADEPQNLGMDTPAARVKRHPANHGHRALSVYNHPFCSASRAASIRFCAPSFCMAVERWFRAVPSERTSRAAISARLAPKSEAASTPRSRLVGGSVPAQSAASAI